MSNPSPILVKWLKANLGPKCTSGCTSADFRALVASWCTAELYSYDRSPEVLAAWGAIVLRMQPSMRFLAFHAVAQIMDWSTRGEMWFEAGLPALDYIPRCEFEPGGRTRTEVAA